MSMKYGTENQDTRLEPALNLNATLTPADLSHKVLPYLCSCGYHLVGFTQAWATHTTTYAHCVNNACSNYYNTQELSYYMDAAS